MIKSLLCFTMVLVTCNIIAAEISAGPFSVQKSKTIGVKFHGVTLIENDRLVSLDSMEEKDATLQSGTKGDTQVLNVIRDRHDALVFRKEMALHPAGLIELTVKADYASYTDTARGYSFFVPLKALDGAKFKALVGRAHSTKIVEGNIAANMPDGSLTGTGAAGGVRFIAFQNDAIKIVFDGNPYGPVQMYTDYPFTGEPMACWSVAKSGSNLVFAGMGRAATSYGGVYATKMLIYEGVFDYDLKHPYQKWTYHGGPKPVIDIAFGAPQPPAGFVSANLALYTDKKGLGWKKSEDLAMVTGADPTNIFANCVWMPGGGERAFLIKAKPGYYVVTTQVGHPEHDIGPFNISYGNTLVASGVTVPAGKVKTIIAAYYHRDQGKPLAISFTGKKPWALTGKKPWAVCSIAMQTIIYPKEDYVFDRKLWVMDGLFEPDYHIEPAYAPNISGASVKHPAASRGASLRNPAKPGTPFLPVASHRAFWRRRVKMPAPISYCDAKTPAQRVDLQAGKASPGSMQTKLVKGVKETLLPANAEALAWRSGMRMVGWAGGHNATGFEFNTPELVERRVKELKSQGFNTISDGLFFWNLSHTERWNEGIAMTRMICEAAHKNGMKVIHHMDGPVLTYMGTGLQYLTAHPEWLQRDIRYGRPTFSQMCLNNPSFREEFFSRMVRFARETGVDGFMIDECTFASKDYCGCPSCRQKFTRDTGCVLPVNSGSDIFQNMDSPLWVHWIKWRQKALGDWWVEVRKRFNEANPNICLMTYTTHYGLYSSWAPVEFGDNLLEACRACDFVGTEIMSRNVFDCYRSVYAFRKIKAAIGDHFGSTIWGLVYHLDDPSFAYFGWALNQMNRQTTWMGNITGADMLRYLEWPHRAKIDGARSVSDVGILFSAWTRDFGKKYDTFPDTHGYAEILNDAYIQYDFLLDDDVYLRKLAQYKLVILAAVSCMSAEQVDAVRQYVANGGALLISGNTAVQDEDGTFTPNFQLADVMGVQYDPKAPTIAGPQQIRFLPDQATNTCPAISYPEGSFRFLPLPGAKAEVLAEIIDGKSNAVSPAIVVNRYGKGKCVSLACKLGAINYEPEASAGDKWNFEKNQELAELLVKVVRLAADDAFDVKAASLPEQVLMSVCLQKEKQKNDCILVHLLNATGAAKLKKGDIVPSKKAGEPFPAIKQDLVFAIRAANIINGYIVSPDYPDKRPVTLEKSGNGYTKVTVKKDDLKAYAIVYLELDNTGK